MAECYSPYIVMHKTKGEIPVPCGKCPNCVARRISAWSFRLMQEEKQSNSAYFITYTYDTTHVPISKNGFMELRKKDMQDYMKRLRKSQWNQGNVNALKYYMAGEYGDRYKRPHYHVIMFNVDLEMLIGKKYYTQVKLGNMQLDGRQQFQDPNWKFGHITIGQVNNASVGYTLMYLHKPWRPMHKNDDRQPQFSLMSKKLGINYLTERMVKWYEADLEERMYCNIEDGKKIAMPRYYKEKLYQKIYGSPELAELHRKRVGNIQLKKMIEKQYKWLERNVVSEREFQDLLSQQDQRKHAAFAKQKLKQTQVSKNF